MAEPNTQPASQEQRANPVTEPEKTFTQAEVDTLIGRRLAKAMKGMPDADELSAFRAWKGNQGAENDRINTLTQERDASKASLAAAQVELEQYKREKLLLGKGIPADDVDYYAYKIGKLVTKDKTFEQAAEEYLTQTGRSRVRVDMSAQLTGKGVEPTANEAMNALIRGARK